MARRVWLCDRCGTEYEHHNEASQCEHSHKKRMETAIIQGSSFKSLDGSYGIDRGIRKMYPETIRIRFSDGHGDFATYKLERVGAKPV
jgi:hypothetical protein